jgi:D-psicose/D-tagatose/L-ribulose 3-epimerase
MIKFSMQVITWSPKINEHTLDYLPRLKNLGYEGIEIPLMPRFMELFSADQVRKILSENEMKCVITAGIPEEFNIISEDNEKQKLGVSHLKNCVDITVNMGAQIMGGVLYAYDGGISNGAPRTPAQWERSARNLKEAAKYAAARGITLCLEVINRYEGFFLNTIEDAILLINEIDEPNVKINIDSYHMSIEERDIYKIIVKAGKLIGLVHVSDNDRGIPGRGHFDWDGFIKGLIGIKYDGWICLESFLEIMPEIPQYTPIWRELAPNADVLAEEGINFLKNKIKEYKK